MADAAAQNSQGAARPNARERRAAFGAALADVARRHGGVADGPDAMVVLVTPDGSPANKTFRRSQDGSIIKAPAANRRQYRAVQLAAATPAAMVEILEIVGKRSDACLMLGRFPGPPAGAHAGISATFDVVSARHAASIGGGVEGWFSMPDGAQGICRSKSNALPGSWILIDRDFTADQPPELVFHDVEAWWTRMCTIAPALAGADCIDIPSSSSRLRAADGTPLLPTPSSHHLVQLQDPDDLARMPAALLARAMLAALGWRRDWGGRATRAWSIYDPTTLSWERLSFDGAPVSTIDATTIAPPDVRLVPRRDPAGSGRFNSSTVSLPDEAEARVLQGRYALRVELKSSAHAAGARGLRVAAMVDDTSLRLDTRITVRLPTGEEWITTVGEAWVFAATSGISKLRAQSPFRTESTSWAGIFRLTATGVPVMYDVGPHVVFRLLEADRAGPEPAVFLAALRDAIAAGDRDKVGHALAAWGGALARHGIAEFGWGPEAERLAAATEALWGGEMRTRRRRIVEAVEAALARQERAAEGERLAGLGYLPLAEVLDRYNRTMAHGLHGQKSTIVRVRRDDELGFDVVDFTHPKDLALQLAPERAVRVDPKGTPQLVQPFPIWLGSPNRNTLPHIYFKPEPTFRDPDFVLPCNAPLNLWRGFQFESVDPAGDPVARAAARAICRHLRIVWCNRDPVKYRWLMDWFAVLVQRPDLVGMPVPCLVSAQGAGKGSIIDHIFVPLFGIHALVIEKPEHLTGRFNAHLGVNAFVSVNEAVWGGDRQTSGAYKALITDEFRTVEPKFRDAFTGRNFSSLILSTNHLWFAPMDVGDRRHAVFDMNPEFKGNTAYFRGLRADIVERRGRQAFLHALMRRKVDITALYRPPTWRSEAADANMLRSIDPVFSFLRDWFGDGEVLISGYPTRNRAAAYGLSRADSNDAEELGPHGDMIRLALGTKWRTFLKSDVYSAYLQHHRVSGQGRKPEPESAFWRVLTHLGVDRQHPLATVRARRHDWSTPQAKGPGGRTYVAEMAPLKDLRAAFGRALGRDIA